MVDLLGSNLRKGELVIIFFVIAVLAILLFFFIPKPKPYGYDHPNRVMTAKVLLETLETKEDFLNKKFRPSFLPEAELEIVTEELRSRYPLQSLRKRLSFQPVHPQPVTRKIVTTIGSKGFHDGFFSRRARALADLHSQEVHEFINRAGQGLSRMPPPEPADLKSWGDYSDRIESELVDSKMLGEPLGHLEGEWRNEDRSWLDDKYFTLSKTGMPGKQVVENFHHGIRDGFAREDTLGYVDSVDRTSGFKTHRVRLPDTWNGNLRPDERVVDPNSNIHWKANRIQLVSLLMHKEPSVYETDGLPNMEELSSADIGTRPLNEFESNGLENLKNGKEVVVQPTTNRIIMLGAVRARKSCLECHLAKPNELLGAFSYEFLRKPVLSEENATTNF